MGVKCGWNLLSKDTVAGGEVIHLLNKHLLSSNWVSLSSKTLPVPCYCAKSLQLCLTLCDPMDCSPPGSSVHGILQAKILKWVAISLSRGSSCPRD